MNDIKFSIIVPVYNMKEAFLRASLNSLLNLKYDNYELIIVDDGSNNETNKILEEYTSNNLVKLLHQKNSGQHIARINGINNANGEYVIFVDSDDIYGENNLTILNEILSSKKYDVVMHDTVRFNDKEDNIFNGKFFNNVGEINKNEVIEKLVKIQIGSVCTKCIKKEIFNNIDDCVNENIRKGEDIVQTTSILLAANSFYYTDKVIYKYRINTENRDYYKIDVSDDLNYLTVMYNEVFVKHNEYNSLKKQFKNHAINDIIYNVFGVCNSLENTQIKKDIINKISKHEAVKLVDSIDGDVAIANRSIFKMICNNNYYLLNILAKVFKVLNT